MLRRVQRALHMGLQMALAFTERLVVCLAAWAEKGNHQDDDKDTNDNPDYFRLGHGLAHAVAKDCMLMNNVRGCHGGASHFTRWLPGHTQLARRVDASVRTGISPFSQNEEPDRKAAELPGFSVRLCPERKWAIRRPRWPSYRWLRPHREA